MLRKYRPLQKIGRLLERFSDERVEPVAPRESDEPHHVIEEMTEENTDPVISEDHGVYTEKSLEIGTNTNIRVFIILDESPEGSPMIQCELHVVPIDAEELYTAVSYVWGGSEQTHEVILDGRPFGVAKNLYELLTELARRRYSAYLWVDAVVIDQSNVLERNHQVALMGKIYLKAEKVLVWLGPGTKDLCRALMHLQDFENLKKSYFDDSNVWAGLHLKGMLEFCDHEYWTRAWIVQEFLMARSVEIWCGEISLGLQALNPIRYSRDFHEDRTERIHIVVSTLMRMVEKRKTPIPWRQFFYPADLVDFGLLRCYDPRDRIYSMLSIIDPKEQIPPDYGKTTSDLFEDLFGLYLEVLTSEPDIQWMQQSPKHVERALRDLQRVLGIINIDLVWVRAVSEVKSRYGAFKHGIPE
jgi:hypothetical protein